MDSMLARAGVDDEGKELKGPTQVMYNDWGSFYCAFQSHEFGHFPPARAVYLQPACTNLKDKFYPNPSNSVKIVRSIF